MSLAARNTAFVVVIVLAVLSAAGMLPVACAVAAFAATVALRLYERRLARGAR
jgi:hypothetical protein